MIYSTYRQLNRLLYVDSIGLAIDPFFVYLVTARRGKLCVAPVREAAEEVAAASTGSSTPTYGDASSSEAELIEHDERCNKYGKSYKTGIPKQTNC